jgi:hypothetical protein
MENVIKGVTLLSPITATNETARQNIDTVIEFFSLYLKDKERFYSLWVDENPAVITPFVTGDIGNIQVTAHQGWEAVKAFWDPIHDDMHGKFDWYIDEAIAGEDPNVIITRTHSDIDVQADGVFGGIHPTYQGRYVQIFRFVEGKIQTFEEYFDTAQLASVYGS